MKQIVDKLNKIAKKINENVELSDRDLIIDSLDSITKAYGGTPNDSTLIVDKLEDIYNNIEPAVSGNIEITENGENINVAPYATATVNVSGGGDNVNYCSITIIPQNQPISFGTDSFLITESKLLEPVPSISSETTLLIPYCHVKNPFLGVDRYYALLSLTNLTVTETNAVNCTYNADSETVMIVDPTANSSITLTIVQLQ